MSVTTHRLDAGEVVELTRRAEAAFPDRRVEVDNEGTIKITMSPSRKHATVARRLQLWLEQFVDDKLRIQDSGHILTRRYQTREPDVMVFDGRELPEDWATPAQFVLLAIEVVSTSNPGNDRRTKIIEYAASGIPYYWIVDGSVVTMMRSTVAGDAYEPSGPGHRVLLDDLLAGTTLPAGVDLSSRTQS